MIKFKIQNSVNDYPIYLFKKEVKKKLVHFLSNKALKLVRSLRLKKNKF